MNVAQEKETLAYLSAILQHPHRFNGYEKYHNQHAPQTQKVKITLLVQND